MTANQYEYIIIGAGHNARGGSRLLSTWKRFALAQRVEFIRLSRTEAGLCEAPCGLVRRAWQI